MYISGMGRPATVIELTGDERTTLEGWVHSPRTEQRMVFRARIILMAGDRVGTRKIAEALQTWPPTVSKWRTRFAEQRIGGLQDAPRPGARRVYGEGTERRILAVLDEPPPAGYATWNGPLIAGRLGDVSQAHVWSVLRRHGIQLQRRRSWCVSTDPAFSAKAADIVGIYLEPPENAVVLSVDEKPGIQALERAQGYLKLPNGRAVTGQSHEYVRHGTTTLFAALDVVTGQVKAGHYRRRRRREFLDFMNGLIADYPDQEVHVILDNLSTHKPASSLCELVNESALRIRRPMPAGSIRSSAGSASSAATLCAEQASPLRANSGMASIGSSKHTTNAPPRSTGRNDSSSPEPSHILMRNCATRHQC